MIKRIFGYLPGVAIPMMINFILTTLYATYLAPGEYGILNIYLNSIQIVFALTLSVFQNSSLRLYSTNDVLNEKQYVTTYIAAILMSSCIIAMVTFALSFVIEFNWEIVLMSITINGGFQFICNYYRVTRQSAKYNTIKCASAILSLVILVSAKFFLSSISYIWPIIAIYGSYALISLLGIYDLRSQISIRFFSKDLVIKSIKYGIPLIGVSVLGYIIASCDQYFLLYFLGEEAVGNYALGHRLVDAIITNLLMMILLVMTPELNNTFDQDGFKASSELLTKMISAACWIILPISFAIIVYSKFIVLFFFSEYDSADHIMQLVVFASMFHGISMFTCKGLELSRRTEHIFTGLLFATIINCLYNLFFIPVYGIDASAHSSLLAYLFYNIYLVFRSRRYFKINFDYYYILKAVCITCITVLVAYCLMYFLPINSAVEFIIHIMISAVVYLGLSGVFGLYKPFS